MQRNCINNKRLIALGLVVLLCLHTLGTIYHSPNLMFSAVLYSWFILLCYSLTLLKSSTMPFLFTVAFFTFLLGRNSLAMIRGTVWWQGFSVEIAIYVCNTLVVAILSVLFGLHMSNSILKRKSTDKNSIRVEQYKSIRIVSTTLFCIAILFKILVGLEVGFFVLRNTYLSLYTQFESTLPTILHKVAASSRLLFYILLVTYPTKKQLIIPLSLFLFASGLSLLSGVRGELVVDLFVLFGYLLLRHFIPISKESWITKRAIVLFLLLIPIGIILLSAYNGIRDGQHFDMSRTLGYFTKFFEDQGGSWRVIAYSKQYEHEIKEIQKTYAFGPLQDLFRYGFLSRMISGSSAPVPSPNSLFVALDGTNLGATVSYLVLGDNFLHGHGLGTQYIAELAVDFGYFGIALFNAVLGFMLYRFRYWLFSSKWYLNAICMLSYRNVIMMPRNFAFSWIPILFSLNFWGTIIVVASLSCFYPHIKQLANRLSKGRV